jgi:hypothetical protein
MLELHLVLYAKRDSGIDPSTTATAPTLPASADPLSSEIHEITSTGSTRCQLASVCFELAPTVTEKTWSVGSFDCLRDRNMSVVVSYAHSE